MGTHHLSKLQHYWSVTIWWFCVMSRTFFGGLNPLQRCSRCILPFKLTGLKWFRVLTRTLVELGVLPRCRDAVVVFYSPINRLILWFLLTDLLLDPCLLLIWFTKSAFWRFQKLSFNNTPICISSFQPENYKIFLLFFPQHWVILLYFSLHVLSKICH